MCSTSLVPGKGIQLIDFSDEEKDPNTSDNNNALANSTNITTNTANTGFSYWNPATKSRLIDEWDEGEALTQSTIQQPSTPQKQTMPTTPQRTITIGSSPPQGVIL